MQRSKDKPELYEVLRHMDSEREVAETRPLPPKHAVPPEVELPPIVLGRRPFLKLHVSLLAGALMIVVLAVIVVIAFLLGSYVGSTSEVPPPLPEVSRDSATEISAGEALPAPSPAPAPEAPAAESVFYAVRTATMGADQYVAAQRLASVLENETGDKPWVRSSAKQLILYVGRYASPDNPDLRKLEQKVKSIRAGRKLLFPDAYVVKLMSRPAGREGE